jgi:hypothetical protein
MTIYSRLLLLEKWEGGLHDIESSPDRTQMRDQRHKCIDELVDTQQKLRQVSLRPTDNAVPKFSSASFASSTLSS